MASAQRTVWKRSVVPSCASTKYVPRNQFWGIQTGDLIQFWHDFVEKPPVPTMKKSCFFIVFSAQFWVYDLVTL
jgi:hypothetical protein